MQANRSPRTALLRSILRIHRGNAVSRGSMIVVYIAVQGSRSRLPGASVGGFVDEALGGQIECYLRAGR